MSDMRVSDLFEKQQPSVKDELVLFDVETKTTTKITVANLLGLALNQSCKYCGSRGKYDIRGNCGSCGAPIDD